MINYITTAALFFLSLAVFSQAESPVNWSFSSQKKPGNVYEVAMSATVTKPWHIYSQFTPNGGPLPTKITFVSNPLIQIDGASGETGSMKTNHDPYFGVDVKYFSDKVSFVQTIKVKGSIQTELRGNIEYMVCNDSKCLPPVKQPFDIKLQ